MTPRTPAALLALLAEGTEGDDLPKVLAVLKAVQFAGKEHYRYSSYTEGTDDVCPLCDADGDDPCAYRQVTIAELLSEDIPFERHEEGCPLAEAIRIMERRAASIVALHNLARPLAALWKAAEGMVNLPDDFSSQEYLRRERELRQAVRALSDLGGAK